MTEHALSLSNVSFQFGRQKVLDDISFTCDRGETIGVVGRSGIGKSTLLNLICGYMEPNSGLIRVAGRLPAEAAREQDIAYVFQEASLLPWLNVERNVGLPLEMKAAGRDRGHMEVDILAAMKSAHIGHAAGKYPHELSGGMQARTSIARAIVMNPKLILADEPLAALDDITKEALYCDLETILLGSRIAMLLVTHNLTDALMLSDRIMVLAAASEGAGSQIVHCEPIEHNRPRSIDFIEHKIFHRAQKNLRAALTRRFENGH